MTLTTFLLMAAVALAGTAWFWVDRNDNWGLVLHVENRDTGETEKWCFPYSWFAAWTAFALSVLAFAAGAI